MIKAVLFDYGGVLSVGGGAGSVRRMLAAALAIDESKVQDTGESYVMLMKGLISDEIFIKQLHARHPGSKEPTVDELIGQDEFFVPCKEVYDLAKSLRAQGLKTGILSNVFAMGGRALRERGLFEGFDPVVLSCEAHAMKPEPEFYILAIEKVGVPAAEILFIDDRPEMVAGADRLGIHTLLAVNPKQIVRDTKRIIAEQSVEQP
jgi:putative hydrolase of the HAD superfamily